MNRMNFDTRTINDLIQLDADLKFEILSILEDEKFISKKNGINNKINDSKFISDGFVFVIEPNIKDCLKTFMKKDLNKIGLSVLKGTIDLNNVDYKYIVNGLIEF